MANPPETAASGRRKLILFFAVLGICVGPCGWYYLGGHTRLRASHARSRIKLGMQLGEVLTVCDPPLILGARSDTLDSPTPATRESMEIAPSHTGGYELQKKVQNRYGDPERYEDWEELVSAVRARSTEFSRYRILSIRFLSPTAPFGCEWVFITLGENGEVSSVR